jgi:hypothetical protein
MAAYLVANFHPLLLTNLNAGPLALAGAAAAADVEAPKASPTAIVVPVHLMEEWVNCALILYAEHGLAASTFAARVVASTLAPASSAVVTGIGEVLSVGVAAGA